MNKIEDAWFIQALEKGDQKAFSTLYDRYWEAIFGYVARVLQDKEDAMDVVQDTFITLWQQRDGFDEIQSLSAYLYAIARYKALRYIRLNIQKRDYLASLLDFFTRHGESPEELQTANELQEMINTEIENLPPKMREVFILSRQENLSYKEIAAKLNISDKTVKKQISNSLKLLRIKLDDQYPSALSLFIFLKICTDFIS